MVDQHLRAVILTSALMYDVTQDYLQYNLSITTSCNRCQTKIAEIFQDEGDFCLNYWQERTYPNI
jgi:hypothetical protein